MQIKLIKKLITPWNLLIFAILVIAFTLRVWRINELLGFYYDQGRDALVIWDLWEKGKFFLIGPTTGIAGVFRGPFYYYLIAPFYFLGQGNPVWPSVFLIITTVLALYFLYRIAFEIGGKIAGLISLILATFSFEMIYASRWLSNPTPMLLLSVVLIWTLFRIYEGNKKYWILTALILGLSQFSFGSSGELFYFPAILIFLMLFKNTFPDKKIIIKSSIVFAVTFAPLILFNLRHSDLLGKNIQSFTQGAFGLSSAKFVYDRFFQILNYFGALLFHSPYEKEYLWLFLILVISIYVVSKLIENDKFKIIFIFLITPLLGLLFFKGNNGNIYGYYLTGYFSIFIIFIGTILGYLFTKNILGKIFVLIFIITFIKHNWFWTRGLLNTNPVDNKTVIVLSNQLQSINWIYNNSSNKKFNVDVYVPPVIPHAYDYLLKWKNNPNNVSEQVKSLYTLYEKDPDHPERLNNWLKRQDGIGKILKEQEFGGIVVQERVRIK